MTSANRLHATAEVVAAASGREWTKAVSLRRGDRGIERAASATGEPSTSNGAATSVSSRCWTMWTENNAWEYSATGLDSATTITARPETKHWLRDLRQPGTRRAALEYSQPTAASTTQRAGSNDHRQRTS